MEDMLQYADMNPDSRIARSMKTAVTQNEAVLNAWVDAVSGGVENFRMQDGQKKNAQEDVRYSIRRISGDSGTDYGIGVYLDSTLLDGLTDVERTKIVKEYIKEIGGDSITAFDQSGNPHSIVIADSRKFINKSGKRVPANKDLMYRADLGIKQEAISHVYELIMASTFDRTEPAKHPHDWLDNNGLNDWDRWNVYIQEKNNSVWKATLRIANSTNGNKVLYDITPIVKVEGARNRPHNPPVTIINQTPSAVKTNMNSSRTNQDSMLGRLEKQNERLQEEMDYLKQLVKIQKSGNKDFMVLCVDLLGWLPVTAKDFMSSLGFVKAGVTELFGILYVLYELTSVLKNMMLCGLPVPAGIRQKIGSWLEIMTDETKASLTPKHGKQSIPVHMDPGDLEDFSDEDLLDLAKQMGYELQEPFTREELVEKICSETVYV